MIKTLFWKPHEKGFHVYFGKEKRQIQTNFDSQCHLSHNENNGAKTSVPKFCGIFSIFSEILLRFLTKKTFGGALITIGGGTGGAHGPSPSPHLNFEFCLNMFK